MFVPAVSCPELRGRLFAIAGQSLCVLEDGARVPEGVADASWLHLGSLDGVPCFARGVADPLPGTTAVPLRQLFGVLGDEAWGIASRALGLIAWDRDHAYCGRCGGVTARSTTERLRTCTRCGHGAYPRLSPAVIVAVERDGRLLLARNARTRSAFYSVLAGFVEVGESLEETVAREIAEEAGIALRDIRYFASQPWPLSGSLMIAFTARWASGELAPEPSELLDAGWFAPDALPVVPGKLSVARALIDDFVRRHGGTPPP